MRKLWKVLLLRQSYHLQKKLIGFIFELNFHHFSEKEVPQALDLVSLLEQSCDWD